MSRFAHRTRVSFLHSSWNTPLDLPLNAVCMRRVLVMGGQKRMSLSLYTLVKKEWVYTCVCDFNHPRPIAANDDGSRVAEALFC